MFNKQLKQFISFMYNAGKVVKHNLKNVIV